MRSVSCVGVIDDFSIHRIGPSPTTSRNSSTQHLQGAHRPADAPAAASRRGDTIVRSADAALAGRGTRLAGAPASPRQPHDDWLHERVSQ